MRAVTNVVGSFVYLLTDFLAVRERTGLNGPIQTQIRALLTPKKMRDMRVKNDYEKHQSIQGSMGIKVCARAQCVSAWVCFLMFGVRTGAFWGRS